MTEPLLLGIHGSATAIMTGVIWMVQVIQYPWFHCCPADTFTVYHKKYTTRIGMIVGPTMVIEAISGIWLVMLFDGPSQTLMELSLLMLLAIWISTAAVQIPCHQRLSKGYDKEIHRKLVKTNWIRTIGWSLRLVLVIAAGTARAV